MTEIKKREKIAAEILVESDNDRNVTMEMKLRRTASQNAPQTTIIMEDKREHMAGIRHP